MLVYLIGFMGSGKSTAGKKLANKLGFEFIDLDHLIEQETGLSISEYFEKFGEEKFRELESKMLHKTSLLDKAVISTGGGTPCFFDNMDTINKNGVSVYLKADIPLIMSRLKGEKNQRPLIQNKTDEELRTYLSDLLAVREKYYEQAHIVVVAKSLNINDLADRIMLFAKE